MCLMASFMQQCAMQEKKIKESQKLSLLWAWILLIYVSRNVCTWTCMSMLYSFAHAQFSCACSCNHVHAHARHSKNLSPSFIHGRAEWYNRDREQAIKGIWISLPYIESPSHPTPHPKKTFYWRYSKIYYRCLTSIRKQIVKNSEKRTILFIFNIVNKNLIIRSWKQYSHLH
jgi:hypothetical protein